MLTKAQQAQFRPLVKRAWLAQCEISGTHPNSKQARETWYREQLWAACNIRTTKNATNADYKALISRFTMLSEAGDVVALSGLSDAQNAVCCSLVEKAWQAVCKRNATGLQFHSWLDRELDTCGIHARTVHDHVQQFDEVMSHFAVIAGDLFWMERTAAASERRMRYQLHLKMDELAGIEGRPVDWNYCAGIYGHMNLPLTIDEADARWLWKVYQALDTHVRRLRKKEPQPCE